MINRQGVSSSDMANVESIRPQVRFLILPLPDFSMLPLGGFLDKLRFSADDADFSRQRYCTWTILGLKPGVVTSSSGAAMVVDACPDDISLSEYDYLVVFGSRTARKSMELADSYKTLLKKCVTAGVSLVAIDNGSFLLAACNLLTNHKVTIHWRHEQEFRVAFPRIQLAMDQLYCISGQYITCAGGNAAIELAVALLSRHCGRTRALKGLADMLVDDVREQDHQLLSQDQDATTERHLRRGISLMRRYLADRKTIDDIAAILGVSRRHLDRLFKQTYLQSAHQYWSEMRLQHAYWRLLNSDDSLSQIADEIAAQDASYLCKIVRKRFRASPHTLRRQSRNKDIADTTV